jgi:hypothetical protein
MIREYIKSGLYSKKPKSYHDYGSFEHIMLSLKKFDEWINKSRKGQRISYYRGFLFAPNEQKLSPTLDFNRVAKLAKHVRNAYDRGLVTLVQKKHDNFDYEYIAIRKNALTPKEVEKVRIGVLAKVVNGVSK